jgi:hypothetical protein
MTRRAPHGGDNHGRHGSHSPCQGGGVRSLFRIADALASVDKLHKIFRLIPRPISIQ